MRIKSFTLIELIVVVVILSVVSYLVLTSIKTLNTQIITPDKLKDTFWPNGVFYLFREGNKSIKLTNPIVYDKNLNIIHFQKYKNKEVLFRYKIKNGIQNSYILKCNEGIFVFKPLEIIKVNSLNQAKKILSYKDYLPIEGSYYK